jgi:hypothetical protein
MDMDMDMRFDWVTDRVKQGNKDNYFMSCHVYWGPGYQKHVADYLTKHDSPVGAS